MPTYYIRFEFKKQVYEFPATLATSEFASGSRMIDLAHRYLAKVFNVPHNTEPAILLRVKSTEFPPEPEKFAALIAPVTPTPIRRRKSETSKNKEPSKPLKKKRIRSITSKSERRTIDETSNPRKRKRVTSKKPTMKKRAEPRKRAEPKRRVRRQRPRV